MNTYAIIDNNVVVNLVLWDGTAEYRPDGDLVFVDDGVMVDLGWAYTEGEFVEPVELVEKREQETALREAKAFKKAAAREAAINHARSLGFTDDMIKVLYPNLIVEDASEE